jgi:hypothetical protein
MLAAVTIPNGAKNLIRANRAVLFVETTIERI